MTIFPPKRPRRPIRAKRAHADKFRFDIAAWNLDAYDNLQEIFEDTVKAACNEALECAVKDESVNLYLTDEPEYGMLVELPLGSDISPQWTVDLRDVFYLDMIADWAEETPAIVEKWRDFFAEAAERLTKALER